MRLTSVVALLFIVAACGGATTGPGEPTVAAQPTVAEPTVAEPTAAPPADPCTDAGGGTPVDIAGFAFNPGSLTVTVGDTVTWTNNDRATHTVTFDGGPDCGELAAGESVSRTFQSAGTFAYICSIHPQMTAEVVAQ